MFINVASEKKRRWVWALSLLLFAGTFLVYSFSVDDWRYWGDDYGFIYEGSRVERLVDIKRFFSSTPNNFAARPSNVCGKEMHSFFSVAYRPLATTFAALHYHVFGVDNPYHAYLFTVAIFAVSAALFFFLLSLFAPLWLAFLGSAFFAFHSSLGEWLGLMCMQPYLLGVIAILIICLMLKLAIDTSKVWYCVVAWMAFAVHLLMHEWLVVLPIWLVFAVPLYLYRTGSYGWKRRSFFAILPFGLILLAYFFARAMTYPFSGCSSQLVFSPYGFFSKLADKVRYGEFATMAIEMLGFNWIGHGQGFLKLSMVVLSGVAWTFLLLRTRYKLEMLVLTFGTMLFYWPALILNFSPGYGHLSTSFFITSVIVGLVDVVKARYVAVPVFVFLSITGVLHNTSFLEARSQKLACADDAIRHLAGKVSFDCKPLMLVGVPEEYFPSWGVAQALWLYVKNASFPVYLDGHLSTRSAPTIFCKESCAIPSDYQVKIIVSGTKIRLLSDDGNKVWFPGGSSTKCSLGSRAVHRQEYTAVGPKVYDVTFDIDKKWLHKPVFIVTWDFLNKRFKITP